MMSVCTKSIIKDIQYVITKKSLTRSNLIFGIGSGIYSSTKFYHTVPLFAYLSNAMMGKHLHLYFYPIYDCKTSNLCYGLREK